MKKTEERKFFSIFKGGVASLCVEVLQKKYDLGFKKGSRYPFPYTFYLRQIVAEKDTLNVDFNTLFDEIESNIAECRGIAEQEAYCLSLIAPFGNYLRKTSPVKNETGNNKERASEIENGFWMIAQIKSEDAPAVVKMYNFCELLLNWYSRRLDWIFMQHGLDLLKIQKENGLYILSQRFACNYVEWAGSVQAVKRYMEKLNITTSENEEAVIIPKDKEQPKPQVQVTEEDGNKPLYKYSTKNGKPIKGLELLCDFLVRDGTLPLFVNMEETRTNFSSMVVHADFSQIYRRGYYRKVEFLIHALSSQMEINWKGAVCSSINKTLDEVNKHQGKNDITENFYKGVIGALSSKK